MTRQSVNKKTATRYTVWVAMCLALTALLAGCAAGPPPGMVMGSTVAVAPSGNFGVAFGTGFGYAPMSPEQMEMMDRSNRFYQINDYYDDYPYDWYW